MESNEKKITINQAIETNHGTANIANGNIESTNIINKNDSNDIIALIDNLKQLIENYQISEETKEETIDDLETISEQVNNPKPKNVRLKKACEGLKKFMLALPKGLATTTTIITNGQELLNKLNIHL